jgi:hypothetical protein
LRSLGTRPRVPPPAIATLTPSTPASVYHKPISSRVSTHPRPAAAFPPRCGNDRSAAVTGTPPHGKEGPLTTPSGYPIAGIHGREADIAFYVIAADLQVWCWRSPPPARCPAPQASELELLGTLCPGASARSSAHVLRKRYVPHADAKLSGVPLPGAPCGQGCEARCVHEELCAARPTQTRGQANTPKKRGLGCERN